MKDKNEVCGKKRKLTEALNEISKIYGAGAVMRLGDKPTLMIDAISSGSILLDDALGVGGFPKGRITEIFGQESSGKTTLALMAIAETQKNGGIACLVDAEHSFDAVYAEKLGVNVKDLLISQPEHGEAALEITEALVKSGGVDIIVVDSVAALTPKAEVEGLIGDAHIGLQARMMAQALRKMTANIHKEKVALVFINQLREKVGTLYGSNEITPGGRALKFFASIRLEVKTGGKIIDKSKVLGNITNIRVVKNKVAPPFKHVQLEMMIGKGISKEGELVMLAVERGIIQKVGGWYIYKDEKLGHGKEDTIKRLDVQLFEEIKEQVKSMMEIDEDGNPDVELELPLNIQMLGSAGM